MSVGNRVYLRRPLPPREILEAFNELSTACIADVMNRQSAMNPRIKLISNPRRERRVGPALTVKARAGDNLFLHKALDIAEEGDVIVVSNEGEQGRSLLGEIMATYAQDHKKLGALVLDGPIRDVSALAAKDFFIYATGSTPGGPYKEGPGEINVPIACGEVAVSPGDIVICDRDGVVVVPLGDAAAILAAAAKLQSEDAAKVEAARTGTAKRDWVDKKLENIHCEVIDAAYR